MDLISRQAALLEPEDAVNAIENLPSVQPEPCEDAVSRAEIIRLILERGLYCDTQADRETSAEIIRQLPSAQPETAKRIVGKSRGGVTLWYQCDMCNEPVDEQDNFCRGCGRRLIDE